MGLRLHLAPNRANNGLRALRVTSEHAPRDTTRRSLVEPRSVRKPPRLGDITRVPRTATLKLPPEPPAHVALPTVSVEEPIAVSSTEDRSWLDFIPLSPRVRGLVLLNCLVFLMATNWTVVKVGGGDLDPFSFAFFRFAVAALALTPFLKEALREDRMELRTAGVELGLWTAAGYLTQSLGLLYTDASRASFLSTFSVLVVPLLVGFLGKGVKPFVWVSVMAAFVGVGLLEHSGTEFGVGDVWSFLSAIFFGIQVFRTEIVSRRLPYRATLPLMSIVMFTIAGCSAVAATATNLDTLTHLLTNPLDMRTALLALPWLAILYTGLLSTDVALICEFEALHDVSSVEAALVYTLEPVLGAMIAWILLGERWGAAGWVGAALIVGSSFVTQVYGAEPEAVKEDKAE